MAFLKTYNYFNTEMADPRTNEWPLISSALYPVGLSILYLYMVFYAIPRYMQNRRPYKLKKFIIVYNLYQVIACTYLTYGIATSGWSHYNFFCQGVDRTNSPEALRMAFYVWCITLVKMSEFIETMVFALRKKHNQISFLHVYHHVSTFLLSWVTTKYVPGGSFSLPIILNNVVHIVMYTYYLLSLFKTPWLQRALAKFKPHITQIQMGQFVLMLLYAGQGVRPSCKVAKDILWVFVPNVFLVFYLFYDFYQKSFFEKSRRA